MMSDDPVGVPGRGGGEAATRLPLKYLVAALLVLAFLTIACGSDGEEPADTSGAVAVTDPTVVSTSHADTTPTFGSGDEPTETPPVSPSTDAVTTTVGSGQAGPSFTPGSCPFTPPSGTDPMCGYVSVPENRDRPDERRIRLSVAVFPARSAENHPPLVYLEGGPGGEALEAIPFAYEQIFAFLNEERTLVVFDQRGVGFSEPGLSCPELVDLSFELLDEDLPTEEWLARDLAVLDGCKERWVGDGVDFSSYNSAESAADVADLRVALGYDEWDLYGVSYGTRLALTVMRDHPEGVRSVILDSTYPPEVDGVALILPNAARALDELFSACASDPVCSATYGDLESALFSVVDQLNQSPVELWVIDYRYYQGHPALLDGDAFLSVVFQSMYVDALIPEIPRLITDAGDNHFFGTQALLSVFLANQAFLSIGQFLSVECHEEVPFSDPAGVRALAEAFPRLAPLVDGAMVQSEYAFEFCPAWGAGIADPIENEPVVSDIPTLVLAGRFDPITPPENGRSTSDRLENSWFVEFPTLSHGTAFVEGCPRSITLAFLADPNTDPDRTCVAEMPDIHFDVFTPTADVELVEAQVGAYTVLKPDGWSGEGGIYQRGGGLDPTSLLIVPIPAGAGNIAISGMAQTFSGVEIEETTEVTIRDRVWRRFSADAGSVRVEAALSDGDGQSVVVALVSDPREAPHLIEQVLRPLLESFGAPDA